MNGLFAIALATSMLGAQGTSIGAQEVEHAKQLLNSIRWAEKAWGAYIAGRLHSDALREPLVEQLRSAAGLRDSHYDSEEYAFLAALFDAAIEGGIDVPADVLEPFLTSWTEPALILLARDANSENLLMTLGGEKSRDMPWLAANNLLFERKSKRWYGATLREITITHRFVVTDRADQRAVERDIVRDGSSCGDGTSAMPKGYPPVTLYTLVDHGETGSVFLVHGPRSVYYQRSIVPTDTEVGIGACVSQLDRMAIRIGYLAQFRLESPEDAEGLIHAETHIAYTGLADFERKVRRAMKEQEAGIRALLKAGESDGFRAPKTILRVVPEVIDQRSKTTASLPVPALLDIELQ